MHGMIMLSPPKRNRATKVELNEMREKKCQYIDLKDLDLGLGYTRAGVNRQASIDQYSDLEKMPFEEAIGKLKAYEERLKSHEEKEEEQDQLLMAKNGEQEERQYGRERGFGRGERGRGRGSDQGDKSGFRCFECGEFGHFGYECTKWKDKDKEANLIQEEEPTRL
ncbi:hypothetical protein E3N88_33169 [Mikania micrantha]|uniref:CCHC-type domain-containing protein n=1 Tax=Mikania micrantha TaxID=192012 RepID=A0A5N6MAI7_9ASTR|nr:hypothetical protein E3N88_33169 [Mikania micrantha]